jgi:hypothetical protein
LLPFQLESLLKSELGQARQAFPRRLTPPPPPELEEPDEPDEPDEPEEEDWVVVLAGAAA